MNQYVQAKLQQLPGSFPPDPVGRAGDEGGFHERL